MEAASLRAHMGTRPPALLINNEWREPVSGSTRETIDPSTASPFATYAVAGPDDVDAAVTAAAAAQVGWARMHLDERASYVTRFADALERRSAEFEALDSIDAGLPIRSMPVDTTESVRALRAWPGLAASLRGSTLPSARVLHYTRHSPYGVVAKIVAYNHPFMFAVRGLGAPLLAGNTVVVKPADQTPMSALVLGDVIREVLPPGVVNVVPGDGTTGDALVTHRTVRRIAFTGSDRTGRLIQQRAAEDSVRHVSLELGGKNAMLVFPDADPSRVAAEVVKAMNLRANQGQSCGSTSRLFIHDDLYDDVIGALQAQLESLTLGVAYDSDTDMGPMISQAHADRVRSMIAEAVDSGANLISGGLQDPRAQVGEYFVAPTLFGSVDHYSALAQREIFGPVISAFRWNDVDDAINRINDVAYGLTASIWTNDLSSAIDAADRIAVGYVWVNDSTTHYWGMPFGGWDESGIGKEESMEEYLSFLRLKSVHLTYRNE